MVRKEYLDGWRGIAVLCVLFAHFISLAGANLGRVGVELFFVLSGRLMAEILFVRKAALSTFFPRRVSRVYPLLLVTATVLFALSSWTGGDPTFPQYLAAISFTANYAQFWVGKSPVLDHIWSLCIEEHLYIFLGILAFVSRKRPMPIVAILLSLAGLAMLNGALQTATGLSYREVYWRTDVRGASILLGAAFFLIVHERVPAVLSWRWLPILAFFIGLGLNLNVVPDPIKYSVGSCLFALAVVLLPNAPPIALRVLENPLLLRVGLWSFSIYMWQQPFSKIEGNLLSRLPNLGLAIVVAVISFHFVEQPAREFLNKRFGRRKPNAVPASDPSPALR